MFDLFSRYVFFVEFVMEALAENVPEVQHCKV